MNKQIPQTEQLCTEEATTKLCLEHGGKCFVSVGRWSWKQAVLQCLGGTEQRHRPEREATVAPAVALLGGCAQAMLHRC